MYLHFPTLWKSLGLTFSRKHFHPRHAFLTVLFLVPFFLLRTGIWFLRLLDHALYPGYKKQPLNSPIFIIGNPRSGTTFTHRLMALDSGYTKFTLWQTIFPAVCCYRFIRLLCRADASLGKPFSRMLEFASRRGFAGWSHIHKTGPGSVESDEMLFVYAFLSPLITLLFPFPGELPSVLYPDRLPERERKKLMRYYVDCLRRHMYATGPDKILLEKVALIAGRIESIYQAVPGLRIVHLVRHPYESIPSLISMFAVSWRFFHPEAARGNANKELSEMVFDYYRSLMEFTAKLP
ncbi:MAG: sulfotransferase, partial [Desulfovibrionales bacterium]